MEGEIDFDFFDAPANPVEKVPQFHHNNDSPHVSYDNEEGDDGELNTKKKTPKKNRTTTTTTKNEEKFVHDGQSHSKKSSSRRFKQRDGGYSSTDSEENGNNNKQRHRHDHHHGGGANNNRNRKSSPCSNNYNNNSSLSRSSSASRSTSSQSSEHAVTDGDSDSANIVVKVHNRTKENNVTSSSRSRRYISKNNSNCKKPPLPSSGDHSIGQRNRKYSDSDKKSSIADDSLSLLAPGSTFYTPDGRKMRKGRCRYSDKEVSASDSASSDEEELRRDHLKSDSRCDPSLKLGLGDLVSPRSERSNNQSQGNSSEWSTGSDKSDEESYRPRARLSRRHSNSSESDRNRSVRRSRSWRSEDPDRQRRRSRSSDSSITVSSLSDAEVPDKNSEDISSPADGPKAKDKDRLSLEILLSALLDADKDKSTASSNRKSVRINVPSQHQQRSSKPKANYTFSNDRSKMIDMENQRLLNNILAQRSSRAQSSPAAANATPSTQQGARPKSRRHRVSPPRRVTNSTVNRIREQQRIERENLALLRRLNQIKPSAEISRNKCLVDYNRQIAYHCPDMRTSDHDISYRSKTPLDTTSGSKKQRPASASYNRPSSSYSTSKYTRPASATNRPTSASTLSTSASSRRPGSASSLRKRPEWQSGW